MSAEVNLRSCRDQLEAAKIQIGRLMQALAPFADHGHPSHWRDRPTDYEVSVIVAPVGEHVLRVSDLLRAHAIYHGVRKELGR